MICRRDRASKPIQLGDDKNVAVPDKLQRRLTRPTLSGLADSLDFLRKERDRSDKSIGVSNVDRFWVYLHQRIRRMSNRL